jgi:hypothetical protein
MVFLKTKGFKRPEIQGQTVALTGFLSPVFCDFERGFRTRLKCVPPGQEHQYQHDETEGNFDLRRDRENTREGTTE